jgi:hypothetical protein
MHGFAVAVSAQNQFLKLLEYGPGCAVFQRLHYPVALANAQYLAPLCEFDRLGTETVRWRMTRPQF